MSNHVTRHGAARDDLSVTRSISGYVFIERYLAFGVDDAAPMNLALMLTPAQAAFVRDELNAVLPKQEPKS